MKCSALVECGRVCEGVLHAALTAGRRGRLGLKAWFEAPPWVEGSGVGQGELGVDPLGSHLHLHHCPLYVHSFEPAPDILRQWKLG